MEGVLHLRLSFKSCKNNNRTYHCTLRTPASISSQSKEAHLHSNQQTHTNSSCDSLVIQHDVGIGTVRETRVILGRRPTTHLSTPYPQT